MMTVLKEIHAKTGKHSYTDQCFITKLFCDLESSPIEKFLVFVDQLKSQWIMEEIYLPSDIILKLDKMHCNMVAECTWINTNEKDMEIVALTSAIQEVKKKFGDLGKKVSFDQDKPKGIPNKGGNRPGGGRHRPKLTAPNGRKPRKGIPLSTTDISTCGALTTPPRMAVPRAILCLSCTITKCGQ
jgi:hypothetical protein